jgi:acetyltransferase-like isoleucine patch superfamily enzyme
MNRNKYIAASDESKEIFAMLCKLHQLLDDGFLKEFQRSLPFADTLLDRWERAKKLGFGEGTSIYDSSYVFGSVKVGKNTWIGPLTIIDGSGGIEIGDFCSISSGVHIYTHDTVKWAISGGKAAYERGKVTIGNCCFIGPQSIINSNVQIQNHSIVGANSFVKNSFGPYSIIAGNPAQKIGEVQIAKDGEISFNYF